MSYSIEDKLVESSRALTDLVVREIGNNQQLFDETIVLLYRDVSPVSMRAAWVAYLVAENYPHLVKKHYSNLISILPSIKVDGVKRSILKMLSDGMDELKDEDFGALADCAFTFAEDSAQPVAVRAFSIEILVRVSKTFPEITGEIAAILEAMLPEASRGLRNKCNKMLKKYRDSMQFV